MKISYALIAFFFAVFSVSVGEAAEVAFRGSSTERKAEAQSVEATCDRSSLRISKGSGLCPFNFFISSSCFVNGLPEPAIKDFNGGVSNECGFYKGNTCSSIESSVVVNGGGANLEDPTAEGEFSWQGDVLILRPPGQASSVPEFPDGQGGVWVINGRITFLPGFEIKSYSGTTPLDICALLDK